jgi:hypothetical protein
MQELLELLERPKLVLLEPPEVEGLAVRLVRV